MHDCARAAGHVSLMPVIAGMAVSRITSDRRVVDIPDTIRNFMEGAFKSLPSASSPEQRHASGNSAPTTRVSANSDMMVKGASASKRHVVAVASSSRDAVGVVVEYMN